MKSNALRSLHSGFFLKMAALAILLMAIPCNARAQNWSLVWADEFEGPAGAPPNSARWGFDIGGGGWGNNELETYTSRIQNASYDGEGNLVIKLFKETFTGSDGITRNYTSARLLTRGKYEQRYGRFEARVKLPSGQGIWPAFWMLGNDIDSVGWPASGEIDIMENVGREPSINHGSLHGPGYSGGNPLTSTYTLPNSQSFSEDFHVFAIEWEPDTIRFYVDGNLYSTKTPADLPASRRWVFDHPFFMILNVAIGGTFPGNPDSTIILPQSMKVDYVRVYADAARIPSIASVSTKKKDLIVTGQNFDSGAVIFVDGKKQKTKFEDGTPATLTGKKAAKKIEQGQTVRVQVRSSDNIITAEYSYTKP